MAANRDDAAYRVQALEKGVAVIEALEGVAFEPVRIDRIVERCRLPKDTVFRSLRTLRRLGWAVRNDRGEWTVGGRFTRLAAKAAQQQEEKL